MDTIAAEKPSTNQDLSTAIRLRSSGKLEVLRITRMLEHEEDRMRFLGQPARSGSSARSIQVNFVQNELAPSPHFDTASGTIHLYYTEKEHPEVQGLLKSKRNRFCYFWRSLKGDRTHAWLLSSQ